MKTTNRFRFIAGFHRRLGACSAPVAAFLSVCLAFVPQHGFALPTGGQIVAGQVTTTFNGAQLTLDQASRAAIVNWQSFGIAPHELVRVLQSGPDAAMLARVVGNNPSELLGRLQADGKLFLINPRGILVGQGAVIDTAAFLASTLDVADADFLRGGPLTFKGNSAVGVVNLGKITAREGDVLLLAHTVRNAGEINAAKGVAGLAAGTEVHLAPDDGSAFVVKFNLPAAAEKTGVDNSGVITAAQARLEASGGSIYDLAVNHSGVIRAAGVERLPDGRVLLTAGGGNVSVTGAASARNADGSGGEILVGGGFQGRNAAVANAANTRVAATAALDAGAADTTGGRVVVWADGNTRFDGRIGTGRGGEVEVSGKRSLGFAGQVDTRGGSLLLDPDDITIVAGSTIPSGNLTADRNWSPSEDPGSQTLGADTLAGLLATGSVFMQASNSLTVDAAVTVAAGGAAGVTLGFQAPTITLNQSVSLANVANGKLNLEGPGGVSLTSAAGAALNASRIFINGFPNVTLNGTVTTADLIYAQLGGPASSFNATNPGNAVSRFLLNTDPADPQAVDFTGNLAVHSSTAMEAAVMVGAANNVTLTSAGNLTLRDEGAAATVITAAGVTKLASTGGVLINQAGSDLLAGAGRRLLYTANTSGAFSLGGLTGFTQADGVSFPNDPNSGVTLVLYNAAGGGPVLTLTITANDFTRLYGQANPAFTASFSGGTAADLTTLPTFSITGGPAVNVGAYTIVPSGAASSTHTLSYVNGTLTINPATLTYVANPASRLYGDVNPAFGGSVTGFVNGDTLASATTGTLTFTSPATAASNAGSWAINGGGLTANNGNYVFQDAVANLSALTVNKAPLSVTFGNATRVYGAPDPAFTATFSGFRNGDTAASLAGFTVGSNATALSPVGAYQIGGGTTSATNYALTVVPGMLTVTPAPLTLTVNPATFTFGANPLPTPTFSISGLVGSDTAAVLSGVQFNTAALGTLAPGAHLVSPSSLGTAQNYAVATVVPGLFTINRRGILIGGDNATSFAGLIPPLTASRSFTPVAGGPQFTLTALTSASTRSPAGAYAVTPVIVPAAGTSLADITRYYDITPIDGTLTLTKPPVDVAVVNNPPPETTITLNFKQSEKKDIEVDKLVKTEPTLSQIAVHRAGEPVSSAVWGRIAGEMGDTIVAGLKSVVGRYDTGRLDAKGNPIILPSIDNSVYSDEEIKVLADVWRGNLSAAQLAERMDTDPVVRGLVLPIIMRDFSEAVTAGRPLTPSQSLLAGRIAENVQKQRQLVAAEMKQQYQEFVEFKATASSLNPLTLKTMGDITKSAQQAATEQFIAGAIGAGVGAGVGGAGAAALSVPAVLQSIMPFVGKAAFHATNVAVAAAIDVGAMQAGSTVAEGAAAAAKAQAIAGVSASSAGTVIAVAVAAAVIITVAAVQVAEEGKNIDSYNSALARAQTPVNNLSDLNLKSDDLARVEFMSAFMATMLETKFTPTK